MIQAELFHRLYTDARLDRFDAPGGRFVALDALDAAKVLPEDARTELDELLRKTVPEGEGKAWVVRRFVTGADAFACLMTSYPGLVSDVGGERRGVLNHARVARVPADQALLDIAALVAAEEAFPSEQIAARPAEKRLPMIRDLLSAESMIGIRETGPSSSDFQAVPRGLLSDFLIASLVGLGRRERTRFLLNAGHRSLMRTLAICWAALPAGLQASSSFAVCAGAGSPVDAHFSLTSGRHATAVGAEGLVELVRRYGDLLLNAAHDAGALLSSRELNTVTKLDAAVQLAVGGLRLAVERELAVDGLRLAVEPELAVDGWRLAGEKAEPTSRSRQLPTANRQPGLPTANRQPGLPTANRQPGDPMPDKKKRATEEPLDPLDPAAVAEMERQYRAMEASLRAYIDERLGAIDASRSGARFIPSRPSSMHWAGIAGLVAVGALLATLVLKGPSLWRGGRTSPSVTDSSDVPLQPDLPLSSTREDDPFEPPAARNEAFARAVANGRASGKWAEELKRVAEAEGKSVAPYVRAAATARGVAAVDVAATASRDLNRYATLIAQGGAMSADDRAKLRVLLLEHIAALEVSESNLSQAVRVDGVLKDLTPDLIDRLKSRHGVQAASSDPASRELQSEIILRWMEAREP